jgi:uncharacterized protein YbjT (DUF2867 family)
MEVWLNPAFGFEYSNAKAAIFGPGKNKISWISFKDVAKFAAAAIDNPAARNAFIEVGGPEALSPLEVVKIFEEASGKAFEVQNVPEEALRKQKDSAPDEVQASVAGLQLQYAGGDPIDMQETLKAFPIELMSVKEYAASVVGS